MERRKIAFFSKLLRTNSSPGKFLQLRRVEMNFRQKEDSGIREQAKFSMKTDGILLPSLFTIAREYRSSILDTSRRNCTWLLFNFHAEIETFGKYWNSVLKQLIIWIYKNYGRGKRIGRCGTTTAEKQSRPQARVRAVAEESLLHSL